MRGLARARMQGRLERVVDQPLVLLDGAHNEAGIEALCRTVDELLKMRRLHVVMGMVRDQECEVLRRPGGWRGARTCSMPARRIRRTVP